MSLISLLYRISPWQLAITVFASLLSGIADLGTTICVLESFRLGAALWWQFVLAGSLALALGRYSRTAVGKLGSTTVVRMRRRLVRSLLHLPLQELEAIGSTRLLVAFTGDLSSVATAIRNLASLVANAAILLACLAYIGWFARRQMIIAAVLCIICIIGSLFLRSLEKRHRHAAREAMDKVMNIYRMMITGTKQLKLNRSLASRVLLAFEESVRQQQQLAGVRGRYSDLVAMWTQGMSYIILGAVVFDPLGANVPMRIGFGLLVVLQLRRPLRSLITDSGGLSDAMVAYERISQLGLTLARRRRQQDDESGHSRAASRDSRLLGLNAVCFRYGGETSQDGFALGPIDISLKRGEVVFVSGGNGSGKTTLAKVLTGLYRPTEGTVQLNGIPVDESNTHWYRRKFAAVFGDFCLFEGVADLRLEDLGAHVDWLTAPLKLDAVALTARSSVDGSAPMSSGERRRIALLRAVVEDRPFLVLDEWAVDQDPEYKDFFYQAFLPRMRAARKLIVVISDDERYFHIADRLLWLERGKPPIWRSPSSFLSEVGRNAQGAI